MSFDLRIHFNGLMMWVPEGDGMMHVLLPDTSGHSHSPTPVEDPKGGGVHAHQHDGHGGTATVPAGNGNGAAAPSAKGAAPAVNGAAAAAKKDAGAAAATNRISSALAPVAHPPHFARIVYDAAYEQPNQKQLSRRYKMVDLTGRVLDLTGIATTHGFCGCLPDELPSLDGVAERVPVELVRELPDHRLAGRVSMDAGVLSTYELGALFNFGGKDQPQRMTFETEWTVRGIASRMSASRGGAEFLPGPALQGPTPAQEARLPNLFPIADTIHLIVFNTVLSELPPRGTLFDIKAQGRDDHFGAYFGICKPLRGGIVKPVAATRVNVEVEGALPPRGPQIPGAICVQSQGKLPGS